MHRFLLLPAVSLLLLSFNCVDVESSKIVVLFPVSPSSHHLIISVLSDELIRLGHSIHVIRWKETGKGESVGYGVPVTNPATNFTTHVTTLAMDGRDGRFSSVLTKEKEAGFIYPTKFMWEAGLTWSAILFSPEWVNYFTFLEAHCDTLLSNRRLIQRLKAERFDMALVDMTWNECSIALARALKIKSVTGYWLATPSSLEPDISTTFLTSSHVSIFRPKLTPASASVVDRVFNILAKFSSQLVMWIYYHHIDRSIGKHLPNLRASAQELQQSVDGMLIADHLALGIPKALPPNYVNVGGLQLKEGNTSELSQEIQDWLSDAPYGVILFNFGTRLGIGGAPTHIRQTFLNAFRNLKQKVLMQLQTPLASELSQNGTFPNNIKTFQWIPQQSVLAHPNVRLFITHGGLQSVLEAIYAGVPMVVYPVVHDAPETASKMVAKGIAVEMDRYGLTEDGIVSAINQVLHNPSFNENVRNLSRVMRNEQTTPLQKAVDLLQNLLTHGGAPHLKIPHSHVNVVQYFNLDILAILVLATGCIYLLVKRIVAFTYHILLKIVQFAVSGIEIVKEKRE